MNDEALSRARAAPEVATSIGGCRVARELLLALAADVERLVEETQRLSRVNKSRGERIMDFMRRCHVAEGQVESAEALVERLREELSREFHGGTRVTNCVAHMGLPFDKRPEGCRLCRTDIVNHLLYAIRVNEWLNERVAAALSQTPAQAGEELRLLRAVVKAARIFLNKVRETDKASEGVFVLAHVHNIPYQGPNHAAEAQDLEAALKALGGGTVAI